MAAFSENFHFERKSDSSKIDFLSLREPNYWLSFLSRSFHLDKVVIASVSLWLTDRARASLAFRYVRKLKVYGNWNQRGTIFLWDTKCL